MNFVVFPHTLGTLSPNAGRTTKCFLVEERNVIMKTYLGIEFGSTRIKSVQIDQSFKTVSKGAFNWESRLENGIWTYDISEALKGLKTVLSAVKEPENIACAGVSGMMHGYLAFDEEWNLLVPFRTWQNTVTAEAAEKLTALFNFNIPQRWSVAHLYRAILNGEPHVKNIRHVTTLAGYIHYLLTGENVIGAGEASGMFPIDEKTMDYDAEMVAKFDTVLAANGLSVKTKEVFPRVLSAGEEAGRVTESGSALTEGALPVGLKLAPPEGDAGTGMVATNAVLKRTGNVSAGTSIFAMFVLEKPLSRVYPEIDMVTTPDGAPVAMVHCNNCTGDMNAWIKLLGESAELFGASFSTEELYEKLYRISLLGQTDCAGITVYNYLAGEGITHFDEGRAMVVRDANAELSLASFMRAQIYSAMATVRLGMKLLDGENVEVDKVVGHGGLFKTDGVGQKYMAASLGTPVVCTENSGEGGPYGMALLAAYADCKTYGERLGDFLNERVFKNEKSITVMPAKEDIEGFDKYVTRFENGLSVVRKATENM